MMRNEIRRLVPLLALLGVTGCPAPTQSNDSGDVSRVDAQDAVQDASMDTQTTDVVLDSSTDTLELDTSVLDAADAALDTPEPLDVVDVAADTPTADSADASAVIETYVATLSGAQEVPAVTTVASGTITFSLNVATGSVTYTLMHTVVNPTAAHVHLGNAGEVGGVVVPLMIGANVTASFMLSPSQIADLRLGHFYANIHTAANAGGEIRGQILRPGETLYTASMSGLQENPPTATTATGTASVILNAARDSIHYRMNVPLTPTAAHIHRGQIGVNGGVAYALVGTGMVWEGDQAVTAADVTDLNTAMFYVNAHTTANPGGELRGQLLLPGAKIWVAKLQGGQEVPPVTTTATGTGAIIVNYDRSVRYQVNSNATTATSSHLHTAAAGTNGTVTLPFSGTAGVFAGANTLTAQQLVDLAAGRSYIDVHTPANPSGELRGQVIGLGETLYTAMLNGTNEVPPVTTTATGGVGVILNAAGDSIRYEGALSMITPTAQHIHLGAVGVSGGVVYGLVGTGTTLSGTQAVTAMDVMNVNNNLWYVNVHTATNGAGEIRGQLTRR